MKIRIIILIALCAFGEANAQLRYGSVFTDNMVIQQNTDVRIWGTSSSVSRVNVVASWALQDTLKTVTDSNGDWQVTIHTPKADFKEHTISSNGVMLNNVLLGEVWLCSGQSNMGFSVANSFGGAEAAKDADNSNIRIFQVPNRAADAPQKHLFANWKVCSTPVVRGTSAVAYFFARTIQEKLQVPVGIIVSAWGGANAETWTPIEYFDDDMMANRTVEPHPYRPDAPALVYNQMLHPLVPFKIAGVIWYQGEANCLRWAAHYEKLMKVMINAWRDRFQNPSLPFYFVQVAPFNYQSKQNYPAIVREAQQHIADEVPGTGMVVVSDLVENVKDIHPKTKKEVGFRLADFALAEVYGQSIADYKSPTYKDMTIKNNKVIISFTNPTERLACPGKKIEGFRIAGEDGVFVDAEAKIAGNQVQVWAKSIKVPASVRYCFDDCTFGNLKSSKGLPVAPFRTDK